MTFSLENSPKLTYPSPSTDTLIAAVIEIKPIEKFKTVKMRPGKYTTDGYVIHQYKCPPCPPGAECKPCLGNHIVISTKPKSFAGYGKLTNQDLLVFEPNPDQLKIGKRYLFDIEVSEESSMTDQPNHIRLIRAH